MAQLIISDIGEAAKTGCVIVMCGLSGTGKGTTVAFLKRLLPNAQTWSNGNIFRSLTLLCARWCAKESEARGEEVRVCMCACACVCGVVCVCVCVLSLIHI